MRKLHRSILGLVVLSPALVIPACGSSSNNGGPGGQDAGVTSPPDASVSLDSSRPEASAATDTGAPDVSADAGQKGDAGILGDNCPAFDAGTPFVEAPHGPLPTTVYSGGGIMEAPQVITFTFATTPGIPTLQSFGATVTQSPWFAEVTKDYCINDGGTCIKPGAPGVSVAITAAAAPLYVDMMGQGTAPSGVDLDTFMNQQIAAAVTAKTIPAPGPNALYTFYFPPSSTISMGDPASGGGQSCGFGGYHGNITYSDGKTPIVYAIIPDCAGGDPVADLQNVTIAASHELLEAATDPFDGSGWYLDQDFSSDGGLPTVPQVRNEPWANADSFGEVGDNCESLVLQTWPLDSGVQVQRIWSPFAAAQGHNPCIPVPAGESYYNASTDKVLYVAEVGSSFTVDVSAFSDMARPSWRLDARDWTPTQATDAAGNPIAYLGLEFVGGVDAGGVSDLLCANNGTKAQLKVTLLADPAADTSLTQYEEWPEADGVVASADVLAWFDAPLPDGGTYQSFPYQAWPFAVITPAIAATIGVTDAGVVDARKLGALRGRRHAQPSRAVGRGGLVRPRLLE